MTAVLVAEITGQRWRDRSSQVHQGAGDAQFGAVRQSAVGAARRWRRTDRLGGEVRGTAVRPERADPRPAGVSRVRGPVQQVRRGAAAGGAATLIQTRGRREVAVCGDICRETGVRDRDGRLTFRALGHGDCVCVRQTEFSARSRNWLLQFLALGWPEEQPV